MLQKPWKVALIVDSIKLNKMQAHLLATVKAQKNLRVEFVLAPAKPFSAQRSWTEDAAQKILLASSEFLGSSSKKYFSKSRWIEIDEEDGQTLCVDSFERFRKAGIDVILSLSEKSLGLEWAQYTKWGLLRYQFGASLDLYELMGLEPLQSVALNHFYYHQGVLHRSVLKQGQMRRYQESLAKHIDAVFQAVTPWWPQALDESLLESSRSAGTVFSETPGRRWSWKRRFFQQGVILAEICARRVRRLFLFQKWNVAVVQQPLRNLLDPQTEIQRRWLSLPEGANFIADPFPVFHDGQLKVFVENYDFRKAKGVVEAISLGSESQTVEVIELPTHISYPSMIVQGGELYCLPETLGEAEVAIYRCRQYPNRWEKVKTLLPDQLWSDPTMFQHEGQWWLLATKFDTCSGGNDQLYAWYADSFLGEWTEHAANPIKVDVASARSAGMPFTVDGQLYRPSQDCSAAYGGALVMNRVQRLTPAEFVEEEICRWTPDEAYPEGCHHIGGYGDITLVDGRAEEFSIWAPWIKIRHFIRSLAVPTPPLEELDVEFELEREEKMSFKVQTSW